MFTNGYLKNKCTLTFALAFLHLLLSGVNGKRILLVPLQFPSRTSEQLIIGEVLVSKGHDVYCLFADRTDYQHRATDKGIKVITFQFPEKHLLVASDEYNAWLGDQVFNQSDPMVTLSIELQRDYDECDCIMKDEVMLKTAKEMNFDLVIADGLYITPCYFLLPVYLGVPFVSIFHATAPWWTGIPALPSFYPGFTMASTDQMTFIQRIMSLMDLIMIHNPTLPTLAYGLPETRMLEKFAPHIKSWNDLYAMSQFYIITTDHHLEWPQPSMLNMIYLPGITYGPAKPLNERLKEIVRDAREGVILVSFGSTSANLPKTVMNEFFETFKDLEQTIIWKMPRLSEDLKPLVSENVHLLPWLPQNDLLGHPKTKLFITHCGNNGQYEALYHGVPMIGFPLFLDQLHNAFRMHAKGFGIEMKIQNFTSSELKNKIKMLLQEGSHRSKVEKHSQILKSRPMLPKEEAAYWVEHILDFGGEHLRSHAINLPWYEFLMLDILAVILMVTIVGIAATGYLVIVSCKCAHGSGKDKTKND